MLNNATFMLHLCNISMQRRCECTDITQGNISALPWVTTHGKRLHFTVFPILTLGICLCNISALPSYLVIFLGFSKTYSNHCSTSVDEKNGFRYILGSPRVGVYPPPWEMSRGLILGENDSKCKEICFSGYPR